MIKKEKPQCRRIVIPAPRLLSYSFHFCFPLQISFAQGRIYPCQRFPESRFCPYQNIVRISTLPSLEYSPDQHHIDRGPQQDADQRVSLEHLRADHATRRDQFRKSIRLYQRRDILQAVDHQHADDSGGKHLPQISDVWRRLFPEHKKWQEPEENRHDSHYRD